MSLNALFVRRWREKELTVAFPAFYDLQAAFEAKARANKAKASAKKSGKDKAVKLDLSTPSGEKKGAIPLFVRLLLCLELWCVGLTKNGLIT